jgi:hypothetical protein
MIPLYVDSVAYVLEARMNRQAQIEEVRRLFDADMCYSPLLKVESTNNSFMASSASIGLPR